ncbi:hypothetical protein [Sphingomonas sp. NPDC079357]|uniref:hypothetical protein n=1 Tax=Sphingomonas sp. NPDC079357 TaxID=3364518 RepID=UPI00384C4E64
MIALLLTAAIAAPAQAPSTTAITPPANTVAATDPARFAAAKRLLEPVPFDHQYETILTPMLPVMTKQIFGNLQNDAGMPPKVRARLIDPAIIAAKKEPVETLGLDDQEKKS